MPLLLDQDYPESIVVKKALNSLMGLYSKEKKAVMLKRKKPHLISPTCCAVCGCKPSLGFWPAGWNTLYSQVGVAPERFINDNCSNNTAELQAGCQWPALSWAGLQLLTSSRAFGRESPPQFLTALELLFTFFPAKGKLLFTCSDNIIRCPFSRLLQSPLG